MLDELIILDGYQGNAGWRYNFRLDFRVMQDVLITLGGHQGNAG
jgi:hypothetical protein